MIQSTYSNLKVGFSKEPLNLTGCEFMAGYYERISNNSKPIEGSLDELCVRTIVIGDKIKRIILTSADLLGISYNLYQQVFDELKSNNLEQKDFLLCATHTHNGPGQWDEREYAQMMAGHYEEQIFDNTRDCIVKSVQSALTDFRPARVGFGAGEIDSMVINSQYDCEKISKQNIHIIRFERKLGNDIVLVNYACHPVCLPLEVNKFSGDFVASLLKEIESKGYGGFFTNASCGYLEPKTEFRSIKGAKDLGENLGGIVLEMVDTIETKPDVLIESAGNLFELPSEGTNKLNIHETYLQMIRLGDTMLVCIPGELAHPLGNRIRKKIIESEDEIKKVIFITFANDYIGYIIPEEDFSNGVKKADYSYYGPKLDKWFY